MSLPVSSEAAQASQARRSPLQERSRGRLDRFLESARALIAESGSDHLKMSELANRSGSSIGSLYQYFPDKAAVIRTLAERHQAENRRCIVDALSEVRAPEDVAPAFVDLVDQCYANIRSEPVIRDIVSGMQADRQLAALEIAESRACGDLLAAAIERVRPTTDPDMTRASCFLVWQMGESAMRLAVSLERLEGDRLMDVYKRMSLRELAGV